MKEPKLVFPDGQAVRELRKKLGLNQQEFWARVRVTQSGGSRYESGRNIPKPVLVLLQITYGTEKQAMTMVNWLRQKQTE